ncbi:MAG: glycosyltransferase family 4 protein [Thermoplasmata archaeon]
MKLVLVSKYPPIEGYVSSCTYWLARGLASRGHRVTVVTNAFEVEDRHREELHGPDIDSYQGRGVRVRNTDPFQDHQLIPESNPFCEKLASAAIEEAEGAQVLDAWYLISYGAAAALAKLATGLPLVLRHAASDLVRLGSSPHLRPLVAALLGTADAVVAQPGARPRLEALGAAPSRIHEIPLSVDTSAFSPRARPERLDVPEGVPLLLYAGKLTRGKGVPELLAAAAKIPEEFRLLIVSSDAAGLRALRIPRRLRPRVITRRFVPPWRMPGLIRAARCVVMPEHRFPVRTHTPILAREVLACGTCLIVSDELAAKVAGGRLVDGESAAVVRPGDTEGFARRLRELVRDEGLARRIGSGGLKLSRSIEDFPGHIRATERLYRDLRADTRAQRAPRHSSGGRRPFRRTV